MRNILIIFSLIALRGTLADTSPQITGCKIDGPTLKCKCLVRSKGDYKACSVKIGDNWVNVDGDLKIRLNGKADASCIFNAQDSMMGAFCDGGSAVILVDLNKSCKSDDDGNLVCATDPPATTTATPTAASATPPTASSAAPTTASAAPTTVPAAPTAASASTGACQVTGARRRKIRGMPR
ncbi:hypothetical protein N7539_008834 [Penicillium diatomitis]|uniref:Cyanovirin-N domain-containing protein n=1 Tax=Penicillium diatomitis TaxID=2819901 RepID=A0A9X0BLL9_9EURO|nr:uncharacterized protein N7539_008834 [Penicillium diatomitis]KAJ5471891.1 hypothetical protein N7539_008834 [Penicillium diatomitis]